LSCESAHADAKQLAGNVVIDTGAATGIGKASPVI
jgi:hypothetical protein